MATKASRAALAAASKIDASGNIEADTLDGVDSLQFTRSDSSDSLTGPLSVQADSSGNALNIQSRDTDGGVGYINFVNTLNGNRYGAIGTDGSGVLVIDSYTNGTVNHRINIAADKITTDSGINVGIGISSPAYNLDVTGNGRFTDKVRFENYIEFAGTISTPQTAAAIYRPADNQIAISTANTERLRINSTGRVGINNPNPEGAGLDVLSSRTTAYSSTADQRSLAHIIARNGSDAATRFSSISLVNGGGTQAEGSINLVQTGNYLGDLAFKLRTGGSSWAEQMRIKANGNVGIGTTSPGEKLHVDGRAFFNTGSTYDTSSATATTANVPVYIESISGVNSLLPTTGSVSNESHTLRLQSGGNFNGAMDFGSSGGVGGWIQYHDRADFSTKYPLHLQPNGGNFYVGNASELKISATSSAVNVEKPFGFAQYSSDPTGTRSGQTYYNTSSGLLRVYDSNASAWSDINAEKDPYWANVSAYITGDGVDQKGAWTVTPVNVSKSTSPGSPFGANNTSSWYLINTGSNNYLSLSGGGLDLVDPGESTDFTIEFWLYRASTTGSYGHFYNIGGQSGQGVIKFQGDSAYGLYWYSSNGELINWGGGGTLTTGTWNWYVYQKSGSTNRTWRDGTLINTNTNSLPAGIASHFQLGGPFGGEYTPHYFDHLRVTAGVARYGSATSIPVQDAPWPTE